jgi:hypothetical protein
VTSKPMFALFRVPILIVSVFVSLVGCGGEDKPFDVSGTVNYADEPLPRGVIWFDPDPSMKEAPQGYAYIRDGRYTTAVDGRPLRKGKYTIRIEGFDGKPGEELPLGKPLFTEYSEQREIAKGEELNFNVPQKKGKK